MRVIKSDTGFLYYEKMFKYLLSHQSQLVLWQVSPMSGERVVSASRLNSYHLESRKLFFDIPSKESVILGMPLYCYAKDGPFIFKSQIQDVYETNVSVALPEEIQVLEDEEATVIKTHTGEDLADIWRVKRLGGWSPETGPDLMRVKSMAQRTGRDQKLLNEEFALSLDEEDQIFADKRESPRARPKDEKWVKVAKFHGGGPVTYKLFDLSRGGLGLLAFSEEEFERGVQIHIVGFNDFDLDDPLIGEVMSVRPIDERLTEFKIGVKFSAGQD